MIGKPITGPGQLGPCHCPPDKCMAPMVMGRQTPCLRYAALRDVADAVCKQFGAAGIAPLIGSPNPAEDLHARAVLALGGNVPREHIASAACWCNPEKDFVDSITGVAVYVHRNVQ